MTSWATLNTFAIPIGLWLFRNGFAYYNSVRATYKSRRPLIRQAPPEVSRTLNVLFVTAFAALLFTLPAFAPSNVFAETQSRLQVANEVLFARLSALRDRTTLDSALKDRLSSKEARLFYFAYGPYIVAECPFCTSDDYFSYFCFALPSILVPHLIHLVVLGLVTSETFSGTDGGRWRLHALLAGVALVAGELWLILSYDVFYNSRTTRIQDLDFFFWRLRIIRGLSIATVDGLLGWIIWLAATNRFFLQPPTLTQRLSDTATAIETLTFNVGASGAIRNTVARSNELQTRATEYWNEDRNVHEEREVVDAMRTALSRLDVSRLNEMAEKRTDDVITAACRSTQPS